MDSRIPSHWPPVSTSWTKHSVKTAPGTSLVVQWLRLHAPNAGGPGSTPCWKTRSHTLQPRVHMMPLKIPPGGRWKISRVATKTWYSPKTTTTTQHRPVSLPSCVLLKWSPNDTSVQLNSQLWNPKAMVTIFRPQRIWELFSPLSCLKSCFSAADTLQRKGRSCRLFKPLFSFCQICVFLKFTPFLSHSFRRQRVKTVNILQKAVL